MQALRDLRSARRARRLGDIEWFDVAYRVYLAAFFGGSAVIVVSDQVGDTPVEGARIVELLDAAPGVIGVLVVVVAALALRSGADGGPVAVESADVRHLLLAPVPRRRVLARPLAQRTRSTMFAGAVIAAVAGQLAAQRLPGSAGAWAAAGALAGGALAAGFVGLATIAHAGRLPRWWASAIGAVLVAAQVVAVRQDLAGPGDPVAHLALLGWEGYDPDPLSVTLGLGVPALLVVISFVMVGRLRMESLVRRGALVSQLRFAVTVQDLRTVIVLRRQLRSENPRAQPWFRRRSRRVTSERRGPRRRGHGLVGTATRRGLHGLARTPATRVVRMVALSAAVGASAHVVSEGTTPMLVVTGVLVFLLGLDVLEPLSQEVDHPNLGDRLPHRRGSLFVALLVVPSLTIVPGALVAATVVAVAEPARAAGAFVLAVPLAMVGLAGAVIAVVRDSSIAATDGPSMMPPEFAGFGTAMRTVVPVAVSTLATLPLVVLRTEPTAENAGRSVIGAILVVAAVAWWVTRRDDWARTLRDATTAPTRGAA